MPRVVDHDERRLQVAEVVEQLVLEGGIEALTIRDVARRAGCSTSVVSHYFASKLDLLVFTHRTVRRRAEARLIQALADNLPLADSLQLVLPTNEQGWREWHTWFAFWGMAPAKPSVSDEWAAGTAHANSIFVRLLTAAIARGEIPVSTDPIEGAVKVQILVNGIATLVSQQRAAWPSERQTSLLRELLQATFS